MRSLVRLQLRLGLGVCLIFAVLLGGLPLIFTLEPELAEVQRARHAAAVAAARGRGLPGAGRSRWLYVRQAERNERDFAELVQ